jgi:hypothetical protein
MYITRFQESGYKSLADFDEDVDVTTGSIPGVKLDADSLGTWKENFLALRNNNDPLNTNGVTLGWNNHIRGDDTTKLGKPASYTISISDSIAASLPLSREAAIYLSVAPTDAKPGPRAPARDTTKKADSTKKDAKPPAKKPDTKPAKDTTPVDLTVELTDAAGRVARLPLSRFGVPRRPLEIHILRRASSEKTRFPNQFEIVPQTYVMPVADFFQATPAFDPTKLRSIRLVFDRLVAGTIIVDDVGLSATAGPFMLGPTP